MLLRCRRWHTVVAMSGGVDSAVAALLVKRAGGQVQGAFMHNWDELEETGVCTAEQDFALVTRLSQHLQLTAPPKRLRFVREYWHHVFTHLLDGYRRGVTPNPDVLCNSAIKFDVFLNQVIAQGATAVVTGHYARCIDARHSAAADLAAVAPSLAAIAHTDRRQSLLQREPFSLLEAVMPQRDAEPEDSSPPEAPQVGQTVVAAATSTMPNHQCQTPVMANPKCQTYFLAGLPQSVLRVLQFPLGTLSKSRVYALAAAAGLPEVCEKKQSMGVCFVGERAFGSFLGQYLDLRPGPVVSLDEVEPQPPTPAVDAPRRSRRLANETRRSGALSARLTTAAPLGTSSGRPAAHAVALQPTSAAVIARTSKASANQHHLRQSPGNISPAACRPRVLGRHDGVEHLTLAQRVRLPGLGTRHYVVGKDMRRAMVAVVPDLSHPSLFAGDLLLDELQWTRPETMADLLLEAKSRQGTFPHLAVEVRIRHTGERLPVTVTVLETMLDVQQAVKSALGADGPNDVGIGPHGSSTAANARQDFADHPRSPDVVGCVPGVDAKQLWSCNVEQAFRQRQHGGLLKLRGSPSGQPLSPASQVWQDQVLWVRAAREKFYAPMPGQVAVFYLGQECLGRGRIVAASAGLP